MTQDLRPIGEVPIRQSLIRPRTFAGAEWRLVTILWTLILALALGAPPHWSTLSLAGFLATFGHWGIVLLTKYDPYIVEIAVRHFRFHRQRYYPPHASHRAPIRPPRPALPISEWRS